MSVEPWIYQDNQNRVGLALELRDSAWDMSAKVCS